MNKLPYFQRGDTQGMGFSNHSDKFSEITFFGMLIFIGSFLIILILKLFQLTIVKGQYYRSLSENNRIKEFVIEPQRGEILDRKGFVIAKNLKPNIEEGFDQSIKNNDRIVSSRIYNESEAVAPLIGYRQLADKKDLKLDNCLFKIALGDKIGKKGVEKLFDCDLKGQSGKKLVETDAHGKFLRTINIIPPINGKNIQLALDLELQKKAYDLLKGKKGAIIASIPKTGEILTIASSPSFNPENFENGSDVAKYFSDQEKPLFNRASEGVYPPGSLFKLITATAALEEKIITEKTEFEDKGTIKAGSLSFGNWYFLQYGKTDGMVDVIKAIKRSNDIFFYLIGEKTGVGKIKKWSEIFGLGKKTNIGIDEAEGLIPSVFWKEATLHDRWYTGDTYNLSIGQGYLGTTPLQMNMVTSVFANNGYYCKPLLQKVNSSKNQASNEKVSCHKLPVSQKTLDLIREGMKQACSTGGTGWPLFDFKVNSTRFKNGEIQTACKTGTAESHAKSGMPHAWISVYAPYENPEIVITVLIEEGGQGSDVAGPIAKELLKTYFERNQ